MVTRLRDTKTKHLRRKDEINMKYAKVMTIKTRKNADGQHAELVMTINDKATPEMVFAHYGLTGSVESYTITKAMPLPMALKHSYQLQKKLHLI